MDIMFLTPKPPQGEAKVAREPTRIGAGRSHHEAPQLGGYCAVFDEDSSNLTAIQKGLKAMKGPGITTGDYQEMRIRRFHQIIDSYLDR